MTKKEEKNILENTSTAIDRYVWFLDVYLKSLESSADNKDIIAEHERRVRIYRTELKIWLNEAMPILKEIIDD